MWLCLGGDCQARRRKRAGYGVSLELQDFTQQGSWGLHHGALWGLEEIEEDSGRRGDIPASSLLRRW